MSEKETPNHTEEVEYCEEEDCDITPSKKRQKIQFLSFFDDKRRDYLSWDDFFMGVAVLASQRSKDPNTQVGACIVNSSKVIVGIGYNCFPRGCSDNIFPWGKSDYPLRNKNLYVCHAEISAVLNKNCEKLNGCTLYVTLFPCNKCAIVIIQSGISEIKYLYDTKCHQESTLASKLMFEVANIPYRWLKTTVIAEEAYSSCRMSINIFPPPLSN